jgi:hypothetical protein
MILSAYSDAVLPFDRTTRTYNVRYIIIIIANIDYVRARINFPARLRLLAEEGCKTRDVN